MSQFQTFWNGLDWSRLLSIVFRIIPALICITFHELSHGFVAYRLGDNTAKDAGRLTLNPIKHIDVVGLLMMIIFGFGWAKPVPVNMNNFKNPKRGMAVTALAGPVSNVVLAVIFLFIYGVAFAPLMKSDSAVSGVVLSTLYNLPYLSLYLAIFNIIPIPPLDGSKVLFSLMSDESYYKLMRYERYGMILLVVIAFSGVLGRTLGSVSFYIFEKLYNHFAYWGYLLYSALV